MHLYFTENCLVFQKATNCVRPAVLQHFVVKISCARIHVVGYRGGATSAGSAHYPRGKAQGVSTGCHKPIHLHECGLYCKLATTREGVHLGISLSLDGYILSPNYQPSLEVYKCYKVLELDRSPTTRSSRVGAHSTAVCRVIDEGRIHQPLCSAYIP